MVIFIGVLILKLVSVLISPLKLSATNSKLLCVSLKPIVVFPSSKCKSGS